MRETMTDREAIEAIVSQRRQERRQAEYEQIAEELQTRASRQAAASAASDAREKHLQAARLAAADALNRWARFQCAIQALPDEVQGLLDAYAALRSHVSALEGSSPSVLNEFELVRTMGEALAANLATLKKHPRRLGVVEWVYRGAVSPDMNLRKTAQAKFLQHLTPIIGEHGNGAGSSKEG
jgi:chromosome segregation ATPase